VENGKQTGADAPLKHMTVPESVMNTLESGTGLHSGGSRKYAADDLMCMNATKHGQVKCVAKYDLCEYTNSKIQPFILLTLLYMHTTIKKGNSHKLDAAKYV
jgi:hypothetical protein